MSALHLVLHRNGSSGSEIASATKYPSYTTIPVGEPEPVCKRFGTTPGSFKCQCRNGIESSHIGSVRLPAGAGHFIGITIIAILHYIIDANAAVAIIIIIALPEGAITINSYFIIISEIIAQGIPHASHPDRNGIPFPVYIFSDQSHRHPGQVQPYRFYLSMFFLHCQN